MQKGNKKVLSLVCLVTAAVILFTSCAQTQPNGTGQPLQSATSSDAQASNSKTSGADAFKSDPNLNAPGEKPICKEKVALKVGIAQSPMVIDIESNYQTTLLEKYGNFDLSFNVFPSAEYKQKITLMVAAGGSDLPDVIMMNNVGDSTVFDWGTAGAIIPLNKYYRNSNFYLNDAVKRTGVDFIPMITSPDGNIYNIPNYNQSLTNEYVGKMWIYKPWLDKLGLKLPATPDELFTVLTAFKEKDPNGNGKADEIPLVSFNNRTNWFNALMCPFQYVSANNDWTVENGKVGVSYNTGGYREGLRYIRKLAEKGLLSPLTFTQDQAQFTTMFNDPSTVVGMWCYLGLDPLSTKDPRRAEYVGIPPLKGANGTQYTTWAPSVANPAMMITKNCKTPEAAFRLGDLMVSEELSIHTIFGEKGVDWLEPAPGDKSIYDAMGYKPTLRSILVWGSTQNKHWAQQGPYIRQYGIALGMVYNGDPFETGYIISKIQNEYTGKHPKEVIPKLIFTKEESNTANEIITNLNTYKNECIARFALGEMNIEKDWDAYLKELDTIGLKKLLPIVQGAYDRMYKK